MGRGLCGRPRHVRVGGKTFDVKTSVSWDVLSAIFHGFLAAHKFLIPIGKGKVVPVLN
jgi:hypothetical protein